MARTLVATPARLPQLTYQSSGCSRLTKGNHDLMLFVLLRLSRFDYCNNDNDVTLCGGMFVRSSKHMWSCYPKAPSSLFEASDSSEVPQLLCYIVRRGQILAEFGSQRACHFSGSSIDAANIMDRSHYGKGFTALTYWYFPPDDTLLTNTRTIFHASSSAHALAMVFSYSTDSH